MTIVMDVYNYVNSCDGKYLSVKDVSDKLEIHYNTARKYLGILTELGFLDCMEYPVISHCIPKSGKKGEYDKKTIVKYYRVKQ